jgi:hypothetical protein
MIIQRIEALLQRWGFLPPFSKDDVLNAEVEDKARHNEKVVQRLRASLSKRHEANGRLRHSITIAKRRTNSFEQFERMIARKNADD